MLKQRKLERQSATTQKGGRSHQYIRVGQLGFDFDKLQSKMGGETKSSDVDVADSYSRVSTTSSDAESHTYNPVPSDTAVLAIPALAHVEKGSHTEMSVARAAASAKEQTLPRPTEIDPLSTPKMPETRTAAYGHESTHMTLEASKTQAQNTVLEKGERMQPRTSDTIPSSRRRRSPPRPAEAQGMQSLTDTPEHNSERQGLASRADSHDHQTVFASGPRGIQKTQAQSSDAECEPPAESSLPLHSGSTDAATTPAASNDPSTALSEPRPDQAPLTKTSAGRPSPPSSKEGQWSGQGRISHERSSTSDTLSGIRDKNTTSHPSGSSSGSVSVEGRTANPVSYVQTSLTAAVAHKQMARGYSAQGQKHATATGVNQNQTPLPDVSACSKRITSPNSQGQPSFTAINPKKQPEVSRPIPSAGTQTPVISTSRVAHDTASRSALVQSSNAEAHGLDTSKSPRPQARPHVTGTSDSCVQTPKQQSDSSSFPVQQQAVEYPQAKGAQTIVASKQQLKQGPGVAVFEQNHRNSNSAKLVGPGSTGSVGEVQQTVTVDLTSMSDKPEETSNTTRMQTNHGDRSALELGNLVNQAREKGKQRQRHADDARSFGLKRQQAELRLDQLIEEMNEHMENLCGLHRDLEKLHNQVTGLENKVQAIRQQADRTRDTANRVTLECRAYAESRRKAEKEFTNSDKELKQLVQALDIL